MALHKFFLIVIILGLALSDPISDLNSCLVSILRTYFSNQSVRIYIPREICATNVRRVFGISLEESSCLDLSLLHSSSSSSFELVARHVQSEHKVLNSFVLATGPSADLRHIFSALKTTSQWNSRLLVLSYSTNGTERKEVENIFAEIWNRTRLITVNVMTVADEGDLVLYSWNPYTRGRCEDVKTVRVIDTWRKEGFEKKRNLFLERKFVRGLEGCEVLVTTSPSPFFFMFENHPNDLTDGMDLRILQTVSEKYEMRVKYVFPPDNESHWTRFSPNGSLHATMRMLYNYETDIGMSGYSLIPDTMPFFSFSNVYFIDQIVWFVPNVNSNERWRSIFNIFPTCLWMGVILCLLISAWFLCYLHKVKKIPITFSNGLMDIVTVSFSQPLPGIPKSQSIRWFLISCILYCFIMNASYQSILFGALTAPTSFNPYKSLQEIFDNHLLMYMIPIQVAYYKNDTLGEKILNSAQFRIADNSTRVMIEVSMQKKAALMQGNSRIKFFLASWYLDENGDPLVTTIPHPVTIDCLAFHFSPNNPLTSIFNNVIRQLTQAGFINKWKNDLLEPRGHFIRKTSKIGLTLDSLSGVFETYGTSILLSVLAFFWEIFHSHFSNKRRVTG